MASRRAMSDRTKADIVSRILRGENIKYICENYSISTAQAMRIKDEVVLNVFLMHSEPDNITDFRTLSNEITQMICDDLTLRHHTLFYCEAKYRLPRHVLDALYEHYITPPREKIPKSIDDEDDMSIIGRANRCKCTCGCTRNRINRAHPVCMPCWREIEGGKQGHDLVILPGERVEMEDSNPNLGITINIDTSQAENQFRGFSLIMDNIIDTMNDVLSVDPVDPNLYRSSLNEDTPRLTNERRINDAAGQLYEISCYLRDKLLERRFNNEVEEIIFNKLREYPLGIYQHLLDNLLPELENYVAHQDGLPGGAKLEMQVFLTRVKLWMMDRIQSWIAVSEDGRQNRRRQIREQEAYINQSLQKTSRRPEYGEILYDSWTPDQLFGSMYNESEHMWINGLHSLPNPENIVIASKPWSDNIDDEEEKSQKTKTAEEETTGRKKRKFKFGK